MRLATSPIAGRQNHRSTSGRTDRSPDHCKRRGGAHTRRRHVSGRRAGRIRRLLRVNLGAVQAAHLPEPGKSRLPDRGRGGLLRLLRCRGRPRSTRLLQLRPWRMARDLAQQQRRRARRFGAARMAARRPRRIPSALCALAYWHHPVFSSDRMAMSRTWPTCSQRCMRLVWKSCSAGARPYLRAVRAAGLCWRAGCRRVAYEASLRAPAARGFIHSAHRARTARCATVDARRVALDTDSTEYRLGIRSGRRRPGARPRRSTRAIADGSAQTARTGPRAGGSPGCRT